MYNFTKELYLYFGDKYGFSTLRRLLKSIISNVDYEFYVFYNSLSKPVSYLNLKKFFILLERYSLNEPIEYLISNTSFFTFDSFYINKNVLIPRSESELLVDYITKESINFYNNTSILDIATGSGSIINSLFYFFSLKNSNNLIHLVGLDKSIKCLKVASKNLKLKQLNIDKAYHHTNFFQSNMFSHFNNCYTNNKYNYIICNPPYISTSESFNLSSSILSYENISFLHANNNGLYFYQVLARLSKNLLLNKGEILLEIPYNKGYEIIKIFISQNYIKKLIIKDISKLNRVLIFKV